MFKENFRNASKLGNCQERMFRYKFNLLLPFRDAICEKKNHYFCFPQNDLQKGIENLTNFCDNDQMLSFLKVFSKIGKLYHHIVTKIEQIFFEKCLRHAVTFQPHFSPASSSN
jgi:hypothetical protein